MRLSLLMWFGLAVFLLAACEKEEPVPEGPAGEPLFTIDPDATGPLTFEELRMNFAALENPLSERGRRCVKRKIERRAEELGDPASYQPEEYDYHGGNTSNAEWQAFDNRVQRVLLAQVVVTYAIFDCN